MSNQNLLRAELRKSIAESSVEIIFSGGHGGYVTYNGKGGQMTKRGGPMDRILVLRNDDVFDINQAFNILHGHINFATGKLRGDIVKRDGKTVEFNFAGNNSANAVEVRGGISSLGIPNNTVLFSGNVEPSTMYCINEGKTSALPYLAFHTKFEVSPVLLRAVGIKKVDLRVALSGWNKNTTEPVNFANLTKKGLNFETQQHLGYLRIW